MKKLFLIDGNAIMHRAFHAIPPFMKTKEGEQTNAVFGFSMMLLNIINSQKPDFLAISFDRAAKTFRHEAYKDYKATRVKAPDEFYAQIPRIREVVDAFNIPAYELDGFEADDVLGTLATQAAKIPDLKTFIVTGDMDTLQLINDRVFVYSPNGGFQNAIIYDAKKVEEKYGLTPSQIIDFKALKGDTSDNIPGVDGIGDKSATKLLKEYGTLENLYGNLEKIQGAIYDKLLLGKDAAYFSKHLATIVTDVPVKLDLAAAITHAYSKPKVVALFEKLEFRSLLPKLQTTTDLYSPSVESVEKENTSKKHAIILDDDIPTINFPTPAKPNIANLAPTKPKKVEAKNTSQQSLF